MAAKFESLLLACNIFTKYLLSHLFTYAQTAGSYNSSQAESIATAANAMCVPYQLPRILLLQGPPGTGKTHTISGLIQEGYAVSAVILCRVHACLKCTVRILEVYISCVCTRTILYAMSGVNSTNFFDNAAFLQQLLSERCSTSHPSSLPGTSRMANRKRPHILVCAPSNAAVDEIIRKMIKSGAVLGSTSPQGTVVTSQLECKIEDILSIHVFRFHLR